MICSTGMEGSSVEMGEDVCLGAAAGVAEGAGCDAAAVEGGGLIGPTGACAAREMATPRNIAAVTLARAAMCAIRSKLTCINLEPSTARRSSHKYRSPRGATELLGRNQLGERP